MPSLPPAHHLPGIRFGLLRWPTTPGIFSWMEVSDQGVFLYTSMPIVSTDSAVSIVCLPSMFAPLLFCFVQPVSIVLVNLATYVVVGVMLAVGHPEVCHGYGPPPPAYFGLSTGLEHLFVKPCLVGCSMLCLFTAGPLFSPVSCISSLPSVCAGLASCMVMLVSALVLAFILAHWCAWQGLW